MTLSLSQLPETTSNIIDLSNAVTDIAANLIYNSQYHDLPSDIFEELVIRIANDLIDDFASDPQKYLQPHHKAELDRIARDYLNS